MSWYKALIDLAVSTSRSSWQLTVHEVAQVVRVAEVVGVNDGPLVGVLGAQEDAAATFGPQQVQVDSEPRPTEQRACVVHVFLKRLSIETSLTHKNICSLDRS